MHLLESLVWWQMVTLYTTGFGFLFVGALLSWCVIKIRRLDDDKSKPDRRVSNG